MALLFSHVWLTTLNNECEFFVSGIPSEEADLVGWTAYDDFVENMELGTYVKAEVEAYIYGDGEVVSASPEEVAYFVQRDEACVDFLSDHCDCIEDTEFSFRSTGGDLYCNDIGLPFL